MSLDLWLQVDVAFELLRTRPSQVERPALRQILNATRELMELSRTASADGT